MQSEISIIIPVYNREEYLKKCLDSVVCQTLKDIEIICINDGSTDGSQAILEEYSKKDVRIKLITQENKGIAQARNIGIKEASARYITFVDSDDWLEPDTLELALNAMADDIDLVSWGINIVFQQKVSESSLKGAFEYYRIKHSGNVLLDKDIISEMNVNLCSKLFRKSIMDKYNITMPEGIVFEDNVMFYKYIALCKNAYFIDKKLYNCRRHANSIMATKNHRSKTNILDRLLGIEDTYDFYKKHGLLNACSNIFLHYFKRQTYEAYYHARRENKKKILKKASEIAQKMVLDGLLESSLDLDDKNFIKYLSEERYYKIPKLCRYMLCTALGLNVKSRIFNILKPIRKIVTIKN